MPQNFYICAKFDTMLSILIPERNYDCRQLVNDLVEQCTAAAVKYEIIVMDDNSSLFVENRQINQLPCCVGGETSAWPKPAPWPIWPTIPSCFCWTETPV